MTIYSTILFAHISAAVVLITLVVYADHMGMQWIRGKTPTIPSKTARLLHRTIYLVLGVSIASGAYLFIPVSSYLLQDPAFVIKMSLLGVLLVNSIWIGMCMNTSYTNTFASLSSRSKALFIASGLISGFCWIGIIIAATQIAL